MADLPRFHKGGIGPIDYQTINEAFKRLDALRPLIESASISKSQRFDPVELTLVIAKEIVPEKDEEPTEATRYSWEQVLIRGESDGYMFEQDTLATEGQPDFDDVQADASPRKGPNEEGEGYAICLDESFSSGYAILVSYRRTDAKNSFVLFPLGNFTTRGLCVIVSAGSEATSFSVEDVDGKGMESVSAYSYTAREIKFIENETQLPTLQVGATFVLADFAAPAQNENIPGMPSGANATARPLEVNTVIEYNQTTFGEGKKFRYRSGLPRLDVNCGSVGDDDDGDDP